MLLFYVTLLENPDDRDKFEILYKNNKGRMIRIANDILHNIYDSEDAVHDAFIAVARNINKIDDPKSKEATGYVCSAAKNSALNLLAKRNRQHKLESEVFFSDTYATDDELIDGICSEESVNYIVSCIKALPDIYRNILYSFYVDELTAHQISVMLGMKKATVKQRLVRGKKILLKLLKEGSEGK